MDFHRKVVLITGGSSGIGAACVERFSGLGAHVSILDKIRPITRKPGNAPPVLTLGDVTDPATRQRALSKTLETHGTIDILINNVGIGLYEVASGTSVEDASRVFEINVLASMAMSELVAPLMKAKQSGWIVNISSVGAYVALPWSAAYCASKSALHSYSESLRRELCRYGIHVSTVVPGIVNTEFREHVIAGNAPKGVADIKRSVSADDVAKSVIRSMEKRKGRVFMPWYGRMFSLVDFFFPALMDSFIRRRWCTGDTLKSEQKEPD